MQVQIAKTVGTKLTPMEQHEVEKLVKMGMFLNVSDFIREAIREKLESIKVIKTKNVDYKTAKKEVLGYYQTYKEEYDYIAAEKLELDYELVAQIVDELRKEGRLGVAD